MDDFHYNYTYVNSSTLGFSEVLYWQDGSSGQFSQRAISDGEILLLLLLD